MTSSDTDSRPPLPHPHRSRVCTSLNPNNPIVPYQIHLPGDIHQKCRTSRRRSSSVVEEVGVVEHQAYREALPTRKLLGLSSDGSSSAQSLRDQFRHGTRQGHTSCGMPRMLERMLRSAGAVRALRFVYRPSLRELINPACRNAVDVKIE